MLPKVWWIDDSDLFLAQKKVADVKNQLDGWSWTRFCEDGYENEDEALEAFLIEIGTGSMFHSGKVIAFDGIPSFQLRMSTVLDQIKNDVLVVIVARPDKTCSLYKRIMDRKKIDDKFAVIEEKFVLTKENAVPWITERALEVGLTIDRMCCQILSDACEYKPNMIQAELEKLKHMSMDGSVNPDLIDAVCTQVGECSVIDMCEAILADNATKAHSQLQRLLENGDDAMKICGFLMDWSRKLAIAQACGCNYKARENELAAVMKAEKQPDGRTKPIPMFAKVAALYYPCESLRKAQKEPNWAYDVVRKVGELQIMLRKGARDEPLALHEFINSIMR